MSAKVKKAGLATTKKNEERNEHNTHAKEKIKKRERVQLTMRLAALAACVNCEQWPSPRAKVDRRGGKDRRCKHRRHQKDRSDKIGWGEGEEGGKSNNREGGRCEACQLQGDRKA
jgi:hypothetical protein